jgi:L-lactate dehydrogenase complex protein LldG
MLTKFQTEAEAVGTQVRRFASVADAVPYIEQLSEKGIVVASHLPAAVRKAFDESLFSASETASDSTLCVSFAKAGIAATGSLVLDLGDDGDRGCTALARKHAVFLPASTVVADLYALHDLIDGLLTSSGPARLSITTGPSRTADIERVLTIGVHGPKELYLLILEGE